MTDKRTRYAVETERKLACSGIDSGGSWDHELEPAILLTIGVEVDEARREEEQRSRR